MTVRAVRVGHEAERLLRTALTNLNRSNRLEAQEALGDIDPGDMEDAIALVAELYGILSGLNAARLIRETRERHATDAR